MTPSRISDEVDTSWTGPVHASTFYEQHFAFTWASLRRLGVAATDLEDVTHDVFVVAHRRHRELARATSPRGWLFGIVRRVASNYRRGVWRHHRRIAAIRDVDPGSSRPERAVERTDATQVITRFLESLAPPQREAFVLFELQQRSTREVAEILQINPNTASARLRAARRAFDAFAARVRTENDFDQTLALQRARAEDRPPREAQQRVGSVLAVSQRAPTEAVVCAFTPSTWAKAAVLTLALGGGTLAAIAAVARSTHAPSSRPIPSAPAATQDQAAPPTVRPPTTDPSSQAFASPAPVPARPRTSIVPVSAPTSRSARPPARPSSNAAPTQPPSPTPRDPNDDDMAAQTELLAKARAALTDDPPQTLRLAASYRERFGEGPFLIELQLLEVHAHCAQGNVTKAKDLAARLARTHPRSPHLEVIAKTCAGAITRIPSTGD